MSETESQQLRAELPGAEPKRRKWLRRVRIVLLLVLFIVFASRAVVVVLFPPVLHRVAAYYGLDASYQRLELSVLGGDTGLWNLVIKPKGSNTPLMTVDYCRGDISPLNLLRGKLAVWRVEADGVNFEIDRDADGSVPLLKLINANLPSSPTPTPAAKAADKPRSFDFSPPLRLDALRLTHIRAHLRDKAVTPQLDTTIGVDLRLSDLGGTTNAPTQFSADLDADPILDALHVTGVGQFNNGTVDAKFQASVNGLRLRPLAPYLALLGIRPLANETSGHAAGELTVGPSATTSTTAAVTMNLHDVSLIADGEEAAGFDSMFLDAPSLDPHKFGVKQLSLNNVRLSGRRGTDGNPRFAGLEFIGIPTSTAPATQPTPATPLALPIIELPLLDVHNLSAHVHDDAISPAADLALTVDDLAVKQILIDPAHPDAAVIINGVAHAPGIAKNVHLDGSVKPMAAAKSLSLNIGADGVELSAIHPYLAAFGFSSSIRNGTFTASINADATIEDQGMLADASLNNVKFADGHDLFAMDHATLRQVAVTSNPAAIKIEDCTISGPTLAISHESDGSLSAAGLRFDPSAIPRKSTVASDGTAPMPAPTTHPAKAAVSLPMFAVNHFRWDGINVSIDDNTLTPPVHTRVADAGIEWKNAALHGWASVPQILEKLTADGQLLAVDSGRKGLLTIAASGINSTVLAPFLAPFHLEPILRNGAVDATIEASIRQLQFPLDGSLIVSNVRYRDGITELAGVDKVSLEGISIASPRSLTVIAVDVQRPRATVTRESSGAFAAVGMRVLPAAFDPSPIPPVSSPPSTAPSVAAAPPDVHVKRLHIDNGSLRFVDQVKSTDTTASTSIDLDHIALGETANFKMIATVSGVIDNAAVSGTLALDPNAPAADLNIAAHDIRAGQLAAYLPPGVAVSLKNGEFQTHLQAAIAQTKSRGMTVNLTAGPLDYREAGATQPYMKLTSARVIAPRIDPSGGVFTIDELSTDGVELAAARTATGGIRAMGIDLEKPAANSNPTATPALPAATPATTHPAESVQELVARGHRALPSLQVNRFNINVRRLILTDEQRPPAAPLLVSDFRLHNLDKIDWGGTDPDAHPPTHFRMDCTLDPAVGLVTVTATANPLVAQPTITFDALASGINGNGLTAIVPEIKPMIHTSELVDGQFHMHGDTTLRFSRRGDSQIDFTDPLDADLDIKPIHYRAAANGPIIAGVDEIHSDGVHIEPKTGAVHVKSLEITKPIGRVSREKDGIHALGVVFNLPAASTQPTTERSAAPLSNPSTAPALRPTKPAAEIRVDQLVINDIDFTAADNTVTPPLIVPLTGLDVEVRDFTNMAPYEDRPLKFSALVNAGKVTLPKKPNPDGSPAGMEERELFAQASANGSIGLYPSPTGYIKTSVGGFELGSLKGEAAEYKENLTDGVFDSVVDAKLPGDGSIQTHARFVITNLLLTEPPGGLFAQLFHAPLDVIIKGLQDPDDSITIPMDFPVKNYTLSARALAGPAMGAFTAIIATAIVSEPIKAAAAVGDMFGLGGKKDQAPEPPITLSFEPGDIALSSDDVAAITQLKARLMKDQALTVVIKHILGGGDVKDAETRSNPTPEEAAALARQLREQQLASAQLRSDLAGVARSAIERGTSSTDTLERLKQVDQQMAQTDDAMDRLYDMLRPGADRMASRRTRATSLAYGKDRLAAVQSMLLDHMPADAAERVHVLTPQYSQPAGEAGGLVVIQLIAKKK